MNQIQQISTDPRQRQTLNLKDGTAFTMEIYFVDLQLGWFITELTYLDFTLNGLRITNSPNMLQQFRNQIPFGLACFSKQDREPQLIQDFATENSKLYILTPAEVEEFNEILTGG